MQCFIKLQIKTIKQQRAFKNLNCWDREQVKLISLLKQKWACRIWKTDREEWEVDFLWEGVPRWWCHSKEVIVACCWIQIAVASGEDPFQVTSWVDKVYTGEGKTNCVPGCCGMTCMLPPRFEQLKGSIARVHWLLQSCCRNLPQWLGTLCSQGPCIE